MKFKSLIWLSGIALIILIFVQYYFITETFHTKQEQFDSKYKGLSKLGLFEFEQKYRDLNQDSIFLLLDDFSYFSLHDLGFAEAEADSIKRNIISEFELQLNKPILRTAFLKKYFLNSGEKPDFITRYVIREIKLLSTDKEFNILRDTTAFSPIPEKAGYILSNYTVERNYFRVKYDFMIIFLHKKEQIAKEMLLTKTLSIVTLIIVFAIFFLTLRNLFIQKRISDLKTDFINNMTHELKTPLSTISVASSSLAIKNTRMNQEKIAEISGIIKKQNRHLTKLIDRILDITIWEKDQVKIDRKEVNLFHFIHDIARDFESTHTGISFALNTTNIDQDDVVFIDEIHMNTVLNNLLGNASKYGGNPPHIEMFVRNNKGLEIKIKDNGSGIPKNEQDHIFDKFFRGKNSKEKVVKGLGLGLYYVKQIVEAHGGFVSIEESNEIGTIFKLIIPDKNDNIIG